MSSSGLVERLIGYWEYWKLGAKYLLPISAVAALSLFGIANFPDVTLAVTAVVIVVTLPALAGEIIEHNTGGEDK